MAEDNRGNTSEHRQEQDLLNRVCRHLRVLIECNQAIVHITQEQLLLKEVCRIITETGGYIFAWIGMRQLDEKKSVFPVAYSGKDGDYLAMLDVTWADTERGQGPSGMAIRTGKPFISRNIAEDERFALWRDEALKRGYKATIGIPLFLEGLISDSVLNVYAADIEAFDTEEVKLLSELGRDLGYGIMGIRRRQMLERYEKTLEEKEKFLSDVFASIQDGISILDKDFNIINVNATMEKWYAHAMPLVGKKCYEAYHGRHERCLVCPTHQTFQSGKPAYEVVPYTGPKGEILGWLDLYAFPMIDSATDQLYGVIEYVRDITARKKAEEALLASEERCRLLIETSPDILALIDINGKIITANLSALKLYGYDSEEEVIGRSILDFLVPADHARAFEDISKILTTRVMRNLTYTCLKKDGSTFPIEVNGSLMLDSRSNTNFIVLVIRDISARKRA